MADTAPAAMQGYLTKRGHLVKSWLRRWFVLEGSSLHYFTEKGGKSKGSIVIAGSTVTSADDDTYKRSNVISIRSATGEDLLLQADGKADKEAWLAALSTAAASAVSFSGVLQKPEGFRKKFKDRFFVLSGPQLAWFDSEASAKAPGGGKVVGSMVLHAPGHTPGTVTLKPDPATHGPLPGVDEAALPRCLVVTACVNGTDEKSDEKPDRLVLLAATEALAAQWTDRLTSACSGVAAPPSPDATGLDDLDSEAAETASLASGTPYDGGSAAGGDLTSAEAEAARARAEADRQREAERTRELEAVAARAREAEEALAREREKQAAVEATLAQERAALVASLRAEAEADKALLAREAEQAKQDASRAEAEKQAALAALLVQQAAVVMTATEENSGESGPTVVVGPKPPRAAKPVAAQSTPTAASSSSFKPAVGEVLQESVVRVGTAKALFDGSTGSARDSRRGSRDAGGPTDARAEMAAQRAMQGGRTEFEAWGTTGRRGDRRGGDEGDDRDGLEGGKVRGVADQLLSPKPVSVLPPTPNRPKRGQGSIDETGQAAEAVPAVKANNDDAKQPAQQDAVQSAKATEEPRPDGWGSWSCPTDGQDRAVMRTRITEFLMRRTAQAAQGGPDSPAGQLIINTWAPEVEAALYTGAKGHRATYLEPGTLKARLKVALAARAQGAQAAAAAVMAVAPPPEPEPVPEPAPAVVEQALPSPAAPVAVVEHHRVEAKVVEQQQQEEVEQADDAQEGAPEADEERGPQEDDEDLSPLSAPQVEEDEAPAQPLPTAKPAEEEGGMTAAEKARRRREAWGSAAAASPAPERPTRATSVPRSSARSRSRSGSGSRSLSPAPSVQRKLEVSSPTPRKTKPRWGDSPHPGPASVPLRHYPAQAGGSMHMKLVLDRRPEEPADLPALNKWQHRRCAECGVVQTTGMMGSLNNEAKARYCWYTELLLCPDCMGGSDEDGAGPGRGLMRPLPWRVVHQLDDTPFPVCKAAAEYIDSVWDAPLVAMTAVAPRVLSSSPSLQKIGALRSRLADLREGIAQAAATLPRPGAGRAATSPASPGPSDRSPSMLPSMVGSPADGLASRSPMAALALALVQKLLQAALGRSLMFLGETLELLPLSLVVPAASQQGSPRIISRLTDAARRLETVASALEDGSMCGLDLVANAREAGVDVDAILGPERPVARAASNGRGAAGAAFASPGKRQGGDGEGNGNARRSMGRTGGGRP